MEAQHTTAAVERYLAELDRHAAAESVAPVVRELLAASAERLRILCASLLHRSYPRLTRPPLELQADEMLSAVIERLLRALREARPVNARQFFALANRHMRWELNELARRLDQRTPPVEVREESAAAPPESLGSELGANATRIFGAIEALPDPEREVFDLVRVQGMTHAETARVLGVATKTVQRRLSRGLVLLADALGDLRADRGRELEA